MTLPNRSNANWPAVIMAVLAVAAVVAAFGGQDRTIDDHDRRIIRLEEKFERAMETQQGMASDIRVIRFTIESEHNRKNE
jgi:hypothetical protein